MMCVRERGMLLFGCIFCGAGCGELDAGKDSWIGLGGNWRHDLTVDRQKYSTYNRVMDEV